MLLCGMTRPSHKPEYRREYNRRYYEKNKGRRPKPDAWKARANSLKHVGANRDAIRTRLRKRNLSKYGMTLAEFDALLIHQLGCCDICGDHRGARLFVDHCHDSGVVRALLCRSCNTGLGAFKDDPARLAEARVYAEKHAHLKKQRPEDNPASSASSISG